MQLAGYFDGLELVEPGVVLVARLAARRHGVRRSLKSSDQWAPSGAELISAGTTEHMQETHCDQ